MLGFVHIDASVHGLSRILCLSVPVPEEGFLLGCVFAIADYPEQMSDKQLLATWKRVSRASRRKSLPSTLCCQRNLDSTHLAALPDIRTVTS